MKGKAENKLISLHRNLCGKLYLVEVMNLLNDDTYNEIKIFFWNQNSVSIPGDFEPPFR